MIYYSLFIFLVYSFLGWLGESVFAIYKNKRIVNRGVLNGPLCMVYGVAAVIITFGFSELQSNLFFLFIAAVVVSSIVEWSAAKLLERTNQKRWWDYSHQRFNFDGYVSLQFSLLWGVLGVIAIRFLNPLLKAFYSRVPWELSHLVLLILLGFVVVDVLGSYFIIKGIASRYPRIEKANEEISKYRSRLLNWLARHIDKRIRIAYRVLPIEKIKAEESGVFAEGCSFYKVVLLFFIGAFLGDITETIFCRVVGGEWMSRSSVVWGPFSIVWGLAIAFATLLLYNYRQRSDGLIFIIGTVLGGVYEYFCSVFTEIVFGKVFWDYSAIPFNLGGRINLLYCFFWGIDAVVWLKKLYPVVSNLIEKIPVFPGVVMTWCLIVFMLANGFVSASALARNTKREQNIPPANAYEVWIDTHYGDEKMKQIYPKAKSASQVHDNLEQMGLPAFE